METYLEKLVLTQPLRNPASREAMLALNLPAGSHGLDAGCGIGSHTLLLAETVAPGGRVTGLDLSDELLAHAREQAGQSDLLHQVVFRQGDVNSMPFDTDSFDWAWSADCIGHPTVGDPLTGVRELARVVRPGGKLAVLGYSTQMLLPGHPLLEARLNATASAVTHAARGQRPEDHFLRVLGLLRTAGLTEPRAHTVAGTVQAPLDEPMRRALLSLFAMLWGEMQASMSRADRKAYRRLTSPESPDFILGSADYYAFFTYSMFEGRVT
jgi:demethylmenaquinone methyltransferase/2-methoxy-6-polyprenyl-1,4-benzoquinol methylase